jgi:hypothetical protein
MAERNSSRPDVTPHHHNSLQSTHQEGTATLEAPLGPARPDPGRRAAHRGQGTGAMGSRTSTPFSIPECRCLELLIMILSMIL